MAKKKDRGWIKLYRQITGTYIWEANEPFDRRSAWIDLLLMANHEERSFLLRNGQNQIVKEGQLFTSQEHLAQRWHWSRGRVNRYLSLLSEQGMCTVSGTQSGTLLTLVKYGDFQHGRTADGTTNGTTDGTSDGTTDGTRTRMYKELINNKNVKQEEAAPASDSGGYKVDE